MTDPDSRDDDWSELSRELGLENASTPGDNLAPTPEAAAPYPEDETPPDMDADAAGAGEGDETEEGEAGGDSAPDGEGQPGTGRKRRRRRRRRKKGGAASTDVEAVQSGEVDETPVAGEDEVLAEAYPERSPREERDADDDGAMEVEPEAAPLAAEEDTGGELLRDLIATWNVPSWDEIVGGLYRPDR
jgi:ribonuclease E